MTIREILCEATQKLEAGAIDSARLDAEVLLAYCLGCDRMEFMKNPEMTVAEGTQAEFQALITRRLSFEPVAYITGQKAFWTFALEVNPDVLIPRPDTEVLVEEALACLREAGLDAPRIVDIGTGSGAIAMALAAELPDADVTATDLSSAALLVAQRNARIYWLEGRIDFRAGDLFDPVEGLFDLIVSNPPYIGQTEYETLPAGVRNFEPEAALLAGQTGLEFYEKLVYQAQSRLKPEGWLLLEIGAAQGKQVLQIMEQAGGYDRIAIRADYAGLPRVLKGRRKIIG